MMEREELQQLEGEQEVLLECDTCSLSVLLDLSVDS